MWFVDLGLDKSHRTVKARSVPLLSLFITVNAASQGPPHRVVTPFWEVLILPGVK